MIRVKPYSLRQIANKFENRDFAVPEIQRQYVWKKPQILKLFDSIYRNYPIGISLIWHAPNAKAIHIRPNNRTIVPPPNTKAKYTELIIDGQQRLSTLYGVIKGIEERPEAGSNINFKQIFFNCEKTDGKRFVFSKIYSESTRGFIRLTDIINTQPSTLSKRLNLNKRQSSELSKCYKAIHGYSFPLLIFKSNNISDIREVFIRINSAGVRVNRADTLFAKASDLNLRENIISTKRGLNYNYDLLSTDVMQNTLAFAFGATTISGKEFDHTMSKIERNKKDHNSFYKTWKKLQYGYQESVDFLVNHLKVTHPNLLPYPNMYSMLAYFFFLNGSRAKPWQIKEIKKWFWHTACSDRYVGAAFNRNIPEDIRYFGKLAKNGKAPYIIDELINPFDFLKTDYRRSSSNAKAYFLLLRIKKPCYLLNGAEMLLDGTSSISNRKDRHHVFPYAMLRRSKISLKWINSLCNICFLESDENQSISDGHPRKYLKTYKKYRHFARVMRGHLIPVSNTSSVWDVDNKTSFLNFINERGQLVTREIELLAGAKIFEKFEQLKRI